MSAARPRLPVSSISYLPAVAALYTRILLDSTLLSHKNRITV